MKYIVILLAIVLLAGCSGLQLTNVENVALKAAARTAGYKIAQNNPEMTALAVTYAKGILATKDNTELTAVLWPSAVKLITEQTGADPLIAASVADVLSLIEVDAATPEIKAENIRIALAVFIEGAELANLKTQK
jgi:PBP1b-binding outer membrane lipoprotein LpoB